MDDCPVEEEKPIFGNFNVQQAIFLTVAVLHNPKDSTTSEIIGWLTDTFHVPEEKIEETNETLKSAISQDWIYSYFEELEEHYRLLHKKQKKEALSLKDLELNFLDDIVFMALKELDKCGVGLSLSAITSWANRNLKHIEVKVESIKDRLLTGVSEGWLMKTNVARYCLRSPKSLKKVENIESIQ